MLRARVEIWTKLGFKSPDKVASLISSAPLSPGLERATCTDCLKVVVMFSVASELLGSRTLLGKSILHDVRLEAATNQYSGWMLWREIEASSDLLLGVG